MHAPEERDLKVMSFGEHLEELRARIIRSLLVTFLFTLVALFFQGDLLRLLSGPHQRAMNQVRGLRGARELEESLASLRDRLAAVPLAEGGAAIAAEERTRSALETLEASAAQRGDAEPLAREVLALIVAERRGAITGAGIAGRLARIGEDLAAAAERHAWGAGKPLERARRHHAALEATVVLWRAQAADPGEGAVPPAAGTRAFLRELDDELAALAAESQRLRRYDREETPLKLLNYTEAFFAHLKVAFLCGLILGLPWITWEMWMFISAGLYRHERTAVGPFLPASMVALVLGGLFAYGILIPVGLSYLGSYGDPDLLQPDFTLSNYLSLVFTLLVGMGIVFQLPLVMIFLSRSGIVSPEQFRAQRKYAIMGSVVVGAFLTPPDVVSQMLMAIPLVLLYETGIWACVGFRRRARGALAATKESAP